MASCSFCSEINNEEDNNLFLLKLAPFIKKPHRVLFSTDNWIVIPTIGAFIPGYLLIVSKKHYSSIGACPPSYYKELYKLISALRVVLANIYSNSIIAFEHGATSIDYRGGCCVDHAHLHILPCTDIFMELDKMNCFIKNLTSLDSLQHCHITGNHYIFYQNPNCQNFIIEKDIIPSQFMRQISAKTLEIPEKWDWRRNSEIDNIIKTMIDITPELIEQFFNELK